MGDTMKKLMKVVVVVFGLVCVSQAGDVSGHWEHRSLGADQVGGGSIDLWTDTGHLEVQANGTFSGNGSSQPDGETWTASGTVSDLGDGLVRIQGSDGTNSWDDTQKFVNSAGDFVYGVEVDGQLDEVMASGLVKSPVSSSVADLAGQWRQYGMFVTKELGGSWQAEWEKTQESEWLTIESDGNFEMPLTNSNGGSYMDGDSMLVQTAIGVYGLSNETNMNLALNASKDLLVRGLYATEDQEDEFSFILYLKKGSSYQQSDLTGKWRVASFTIDSAADHPARGDSTVITVADDGSFSAVWRDWDGSSEAVSGTLSIATNGMVTVSDADGDSFELFLNAGKNTMAGCYTDSDGDLEMDIALKVAETDPSEEWVQDGRLIKARNQFAGGLIGGKIYAFGGNESYTGDKLRSIEVYDLSSNVPVYGTDHPLLYVEELTGAEYEGDFYSFGAWGYADGDWESGNRNINLKYNPASGSWTTLAVRPDTICSAGGCAVVYGDEIFVFSGSAANTNDWIPSTKVHAYNPASNSWRYVTDVPVTIEMFGLARVGNLAYLIGGWNGSTEQVLSSVMTFNFDTGVWTQNAGIALPAPARVFTYQHALPVINGKIYCVGGDVAPDERTDQVDVYDTVSDTWSDGPDLPVPTSGHCVLQENGSIYVVGGTIGYDSEADEDICTDNIWRWDAVELPQCGVSVSRIQYADGSGRTIDYDFSSGEIVQDSEGSDGIVIPATSVLSRGAGEESSTFLLGEYSSEMDTVAALTNDVLSLRINRAQSAGEDVEGGWAMGAEGSVAPASSNWTFQVSFADFFGVGEENHYLDIDIGGGGWDASLSPGVYATWYTGWYQGTYYSNGLIFGASIWNDSLDDDIWESDDVILTGLSPITTTLDLKMEVSNGVTFVASYRVNDGSWETLGQHTVSEGSMLGFPELSPYVDLESGIYAGDPNDTDDDGLPDYWEEQYFTDATAGDAAAMSSNGVNTVRECYIAGLDPTAANARFQISDFSLQPSESILQWQNVSGRVYSVWFSTNLMSGFQCLESNIPWAQASFTNQTDAPSRFYRIGVELEE